MSDCLIGCIVSDDEGRGYYCEECPERAVDLAREACAATARAEDAEREVERLRDVLEEVRRVFDLQCPPMSPEKYVDRGAYYAHCWWSRVLGGVLNREAER